MEEGKKMKAMLDAQKADKVQGDREGDERLLTEGNRDGAEIQ